MRTFYLPRQGGSDNGNRYLHPLRLSAHPPAGLSALSGPAALRQGVDGGHRGGESADACAGRGLDGGLQAAGAGDGGGTDHGAHLPGAVFSEYQTIFYKGIMPSEKVLDFPVDCNTLTGSVNL